MELFVKIEFDVPLISSTLESSLRSIAIRFGDSCNRTTCIENDKLWSKGVATYAYSASVYYA